VNKKARSHALLRAHWVSEPSRLAAGYAVRAAGGATRLSAAAQSSQIARSAGRQSEHQIAPQRSILYHSHKAQEKAN